MAFYEVLLAVCAVWVVYDGFRRGSGIAAFLWGIGTYFAGPLVIPVYFAKRPLKNGEIRTGGTAWNVLRNFAILWSVMMAIAVTRGLINDAKVMAYVQTEALRAAGMRGIMQGLRLSVAFWLLPTAGALVLGLFVRNTSIREESSRREVPTEGRLVL